VGGVADALVQVMRPIWTDCRGVARKVWVQQDDSTTTVSLFDCSAGDDNFQVRTKLSNKGPGSAGALNEPKKK